jgi:predicted ATPase
LAKDSEGLASYLREFEEHSLVYEERTVLELEYAFKHALEHEAVYHSILEKHRKQFHSQIASCIEQLYHERLEEYYEELSYHYSMTDDTEKAVNYLIKSGKKAKRNYANDIAISYFQKALDLIDSSRIVQKDLKLEAYQELGEVYLGMGRTSDAEKTFKKAIELAKELALPPRQLVKLYYWFSGALWWQSKYEEVLQCGMMGDYKNSILLLEKSLELSNRIGDNKSASFCYGRLSGAYFLFGDIDKALMHKPI